MNQPDISVEKSALLSRPLVTLITVNYNSMSKLDLILTCVESMLLLKWRPLEIIFVDNGSTDGSFDKIMEFARKQSIEDIRLVFLPLRNNIGFANANNAGFRICNPASKYIAIMNNDLAPGRDSLDYLVDFLESHPYLAGVQPVVMDWDNLRINTAGCIFTVWGAAGLGNGLPRNSVKKPFLVSHLYGAYSVYRKSSLSKTGGLFLPEFFMYGDDYELGSRLWANGKPVALVPVNGGRHYGSATTGESPINLYYRMKNETAVMVMYSGSVSFLVLMRALGVLGYSFVRNQRDKTRAFIDGIVFGRKMHKTLPKRMRNAIRYVPRTNFSLSDYVFMHSRFSVREQLQRKILDKMMKKYQFS